MTFSYNAKKEVAKLNNLDEDAFLSLLSALIRTSGEINLNNKKFSVIIKTEIFGIYEVVTKILEHLYGFSVQLEISDDENYMHNVRYEIKIGSEYAYQILTDCGIIYLDENHNTNFTNGIDKYQIQTKQQMKAYIKGAFLGCSTSNIVLSSNKNAKHNTGYHLEFVFSSEQLATDFAHLLANFNISSKKIKRKNSFVVYVKEGEVISDLLALVEANNSVNLLQNEIIYRSVKNNINRQNNCLTGNISKTVDASIKQTNAIKTIKEVMGLDTLSKELYQTAMLRLANPEESLDSLVKLSDKPISKSGLNHRLNKLIKIAKTLKD